ncbi:hypothetical protein Tco_0757243 [Tanacetum coccineum]
MLKMVPETPLQFGVAERLSRTFRAESMGIRAEAPKMLWADSVSTTYLIYRIPYVPIGLRILEEEWRGKDTSLVHLKAAAQMKCDIAFEIRRVTRLSEAEISHLWTQFMEPIQKSLSPGGSSDTSEGSENSRSFEDSGRSDEEYSEDGASSKEGGFETQQNQTFSLVRISAGKKASQRLWMFKVKEEQNGRKRYKPRLVGDEREVEVLRSFNWPPSELITDDGVLLERGYSQFNDVSSGYLVVQPQVNPDSTIAQELYTVQRSVQSSNLDYIGYKSEEGPLVSEGRTTGWFEELEFVAVGVGIPLPPGGWEWIGGILYGRRLDSSTCTMRLGGETLLSGESDCCGGWWIPLGGGRPGFGEAVVPGHG